MVISTCIVLDKVSLLFQINLHESSLQPVTGTVGAGTQDNTCFVLPNRFSPVLGCVLPAACMRVITRGTFMPQRTGTVCPRPFKTICSRPFRSGCRTSAAGDRDCVSRGLLNDVTNNPSGQALVKRILLNMNSMNLVSG